MMLTDLSTTPIAETLRRLAAERQSGDLLIQSGKVMKNVFFDHGRVVFAASNLKRDRLGESLVAHGRITDEQYARAVALLKGDVKRKIGEALVQAGVLDKNEIGRSVARQVDRIVVSVFGFTEGVATFEDRPCAIPLEYMVSLSVPRLLYDGVKSMASQELVLAGLGDLDRKVKLAAVTPFPFRPEDATKEEREVLEQAQRQPSLRRLGWAPGGLDFDKLRATYALLASGFLTEAQAAEAPPVIQMETGTFLLSALQRMPDPSAAEAVRKEVKDELERSARLDREAWLKVSQSAPREELVRALEDKMERYHALLDSAGDDEDLKTDLEVILGRASAMLRLSRQAPEPATPPPPPPIPQPAPVARPAAPPPPPPPPVVRREPDPAAAPAAEASRPEAPKEEAPAPAAESRPAPTDMQIEHLMMEGEVRMTVSDYANAIKVYERLVDLMPNVAAFHARLAIAMASYPRTVKQAEREFVEALRLEPNNADIHYQFGMYYKIMKQRSRALAEMQAVVRLNPRHALARKELEALAPKDSGLISLKKLFK
jgi:tetratricopeptide (TPR) repeat protein